MPLWLRLGYYLDKRAKTSLWPTPGALETLKLLTSLVQFAQSVGINIMALKFWLRASALPTHAVARLLVNVGLL